ncbi:unnamed protein product, partial [Discosporangium mesarthrocarpum]
KPPHYRGVSEVMDDAIGKGPTSGAGVIFGMSRLGPQAERSSQWVNRCGDAHAPLQREALVIDAMADKRLYENELSRMRTDATFLEDQVRRLSEELHCYQLRYPNAGLGGGGADGEGNGIGGANAEGLPPWVTSAEVMSPLLAAYDARIKELEGQVSSQKEELEGLNRQAEQLVNENEKIRESQIKDMESLLQQAGESGG